MQRLSELGNLDIVAVYSLHSASPMKKQTAEWWSLFLHCLSSRMPYITYALIIVASPVSHSLPHRLRNKELNAGDKGMLVYVRD